MSQLSSERAKFFKWAESHNSRLIIEYHNQMKRLMQNEIAWFNQEIAKNDSSDDYITQLQYSKKLYSNEYLNYTRSNVFLMLYSHLEEWLENLRGSFTPEILKDQNGVSSIGRFRPVVKAAGIDLGKSAEWSFLANCAYVRDCLLHANGRLSMVKKKNELEAYIKSPSSGILLESDRIKIQGELVQKLSKATESLVEEILSSVKT
jgi:hypothetical protein